LYCFAQVGIQLVLRDHIRTPACDLAKALRQGQPLAEKVIAPWKVDEKVDVAVQPLLVACYGSKNPNSARPEFSAGTLD
jgi:hypothetical protein